MVAQRSLAALAAALALVLAMSGCASRQRADEKPALRPALEGETAYALRCVKILTCDENDAVINGGMILVREGKIEYVGPPLDPPEGYVEVEVGPVWASPGLVDLHSHVVSTGFDINDMVYPINQALSTRPAIDPGNEMIRVGTAAGITTLFLIPGSGTSISGFGVLFKTKLDTGYEDCVLRDPGGMKAAQNFNPQRGAGDLGSSWCGLAWNMEDVNDKAVAALEQGREDWRLENLKRVHAGELPVLIHCASAEGVADVVRMWKLHYGTKCIVSHGDWDGFKAAGFVAKHQVPLNHGPRTMDYSRTYRPGRMVGTSAEFVDAGVPLFSLNTDSPVIPQHEFALQGAMSARLGADPYQMLRALTTHPAQSFLAADRIGSLEVGKDADIVLSSGDPLDPRSRVELVLIDGEIQYSRQEDGQWF